MSLSLVQEARQAMTLTTAQQFSLQVLQMSEAEVADLLDDEAALNPFIESAQVQTPKGSSENSDDEPTPARQAELEPLEHMYEYWGSSDHDDIDPLDFAAADISLADELLSETLVLAANDAQRHILRILTASLNEQGLLTQPVEELQELFFVPEANRRDWYAALDLLQSVEPGGFGASNTATMLALQVRRRRRCGECDPTTADNLIAVLSRGLACAATLDAGTPEGKLLRSLNPRPAAPYGSVKQSYITPDLRVTQNAHGQLSMVWLGRRLQLSTPTTAELANEQTNSHYRRAQVLCHAVDARRNTLMRVAELACLTQRAFLFKGGPLHVLYQKDAAAKIGLSAGTVSRAIAGKYLETPRGTLALQTLFCEAGASGSARVTREEILRRLSGIIASEDPCAPYSDQALMTQLKHSGIDVSRRTVALYRAELGIPVRSKRRRP